MENRIKSSVINVGSANIDNLIEWFLHKENMSHKKIQKICYYAQAWSLTLNNADIVRGIEFEAWAHGPVCVDIWHKCKQFAWRDIMISEDHISKSLEEIEINFSEDEKNLLELVWETYGKFDADTLESMTHEEKPWKIARGNLKTFERCNNKISKESIKEYYINFYEN